VWYNIRRGASDQDIHHATTHAIRVREHDDGLEFIGADPAGNLLHILARETPNGLVVFHALYRGEVLPMTKKRKQTLAEKLAPMSIAEIRAMTDDEAAELMGATSEEIARQRGAGGASLWKESAIASTDEWHEKIAADIAAGRVRVIDNPDEIERYRRMGRRGRPRLGEQDSVQLRVRVPADRLALIDEIAEIRRQSRSEFLREAIEKHIASSR
jgi:hypothetical protein